MPLETISDLQKTFLAENYILRPYTEALDEYKKSGDCTLMISWLKLMDKVKPATTMVAGAVALEIKQEVQTAVDEVLNAEPGYQLDPNAEAPTVAEIPAFSDGQFLYIGSGNWVDGINVATNGEVTIGLFTRYFKHDGSAHPVDNPNHYPLKGNQDWSIGYMANVREDAPASLTDLYTIGVEIKDTKTGKLITLLPSAHDKAFTSPEDPKVNITSSYWSKDLKTAQDIQRAKFFNNIIQADRTEWGVPVGEFEITLTATRNYDIPESDTPVVLKRIVTVYDENFPPAVEPEDETGDPGSGGSVQE